jgi:hypothetical protein
VSKASRRYYRTILLGLAAMATLIWAAVDQFGISTEDMTTLFLGALLVTGIIVLCAGLFTVLWIVLRRLMQRRDIE